MSQDQTPRHVDSGMDDDARAEREAERVHFRNLANARDELRGLTARMNHFLADDDYRKLLTFAELKVLGAASDVMSHIADRLAT